MNTNPHNARGAIRERKQAWMRERQSVAASVAVGPDSELSFTQRHYSPAEVAAMWGISVDKARRIFESEAGVLVFGGDGVRRRYRTLRIPESVIERVHRRLSNPGGPRC